jgi:hypothetical protein
MWNRNRRVESCQTVSKQRRYYELDIAPEISSLFGTKLFSDLNFVGLFGHNNHRLQSLNL